MRNVEAVKHMSAEELMDLILSLKKYCPQYKDGTVYCDKTNCRPCLKLWLESEA